MEPLEWIGLIGIITSALSAGGSAISKGVEGNKAEAEQEKVEESQSKIQKEQEVQKRKAYADRRRAAMARIVNSHLLKMPENYTTPTKVYEPVAPSSSVSDVLSGVSQASAAGAGIADKAYSYQNPSPAPVVPVTTNAKVN